MTEEEWAEGLRHERYKAIGVVYYAWWAERVNAGLRIPQWDTFTREEMDRWLLQICRFTWVDVVREYARFLRDALDTSSRSHRVSAGVGMIGAVIEVGGHPRCPGPLEVDARQASPSEEATIGRKLRFTGGEVSFGSHGGVWLIVKPFRPEGICPLALWSKSQASQDAHDLRAGAES